MGESIRLFHASDIHFGAEDTDALDWFAAIVHAELPDAIVVTGDLTMRARRREYVAAANWLQSLGRPVTVEVGNHDLPYFNPFARLFSPYRRYRVLEKMIERPLTIPGVTIVPLRTTARFQWRWNWSKGQVADDQLARTLAMLATVPKDGVVLVAAHHPLIDAGTRSQACTRGGAEALAAVTHAGAHAVLTGHVHDPFDMTHRIGDREVRLIGAGTLSERTRDTRPSFNELRIAGQRIETEVRAMA